MKTLVTDSVDRGKRLDIWLGEKCPEHSRARWQALIASGHVRIAAAPVKASRRLGVAETVTIEEPPPTPSPLQPEQRNLDIIFEDSDILVLNKPSGLVVHPAPGHEGGTLVNALLFHCEDLMGVGGELRPGIVHRLDRDTTGVMVVAKNETAHRQLVDQFREREINKEYLAIVWGRPEPPSGTIRTLIGRSEHDRKKMSTNVLSGRTSVTHYQTLEDLGIATLVKLDLETGRTHQIRVHMAHIGHPVVGDATYGGRKKAVKTMSASRQMLHAERIAFFHPTTCEQLEFHAPIPEDMRKLIAELREEKSRTGSSQG